MLQPFDTINPRPRHCTTVAVEIGIALKALLKPDYRPVREVQCGPHGTMPISRAGKDDQTRLGCCLVRFQERAPKLLLEVCANILQRFGGTCEVFVKVMLVQGVTSYQEGKRTLPFWRHLLVSKLLCEPPTGSSKLALIFSPFCLSAPASIDRDSAKGPPQLWERREGREQALFEGRPSRRARRVEPPNRCGPRQVRNVVVPKIAQDLILGREARVVPIDLASSDRGLEFAARDPE